MEFYPYKFEAPLDRFGVGKTRKVWYNVVFLPPVLIGELPFGAYPRLRVEGEIADIPINNAFMPTGDGRYYLIVAPTVMKGADVDLGDLVEVRFKVADQDHVDVPKILEKALAEAKKSQSAWGALTPGKKRMLAQHVASAKTDPTAVRRTNEAIDALLNFGADLRAWRQAKEKS
ncbi:MAG: YdeI/OmpD-associated family protein [Pseudomonadota bacterium]